VRPNAQAQLRATFQRGRCGLLTNRATRAATTNSLIQSPVSCSDTLGCRRFESTQTTTAPAKSEQYEADEQEDNC
jgi:hypothetical protein